MKCVSDWAGTLCDFMLTEGSDVRTKIEALKRVILMILNGEKMQSILMTVIRFVMPQQDHTIKKLLLIFWEVVPKYTADGKMMQEMILVCDAYRKVWAVMSLSSHVSGQHTMNACSGNISEWPNFQN